MSAAASGARRDNLYAATPPRRVLVPSAAETTAPLTGMSVGQGTMGTCQESHPRPGATMTGSPLDGFSPADPGVVRGGVRRADAGPGRGVAGDRQRRGHAGRRADRLGQDAGRVLVGHRQAGGAAAARRPETACPGALRLPAQGAGGGHRAEPARAADRDQARRAPAGPARAGHQGRGAHRRHRRRGAQEAGRQAAGHPHHHPGVALPAAHLAGQGDPARGRDGHRGRGARGRGEQARRPPGPVPGAPGRPARNGRAGPARAGVRPAQRVGLSATVRPVEEVATFLGGTRAVTVVQPPAPSASSCRSSSRSRT